VRNCILSCNDGQGVHPPSPGVILVNLKTVN
jgi:hypothetical protein